MVDLENLSLVADRNLVPKASGSNSLRLSAIYHGRFGEDARHAQQTAWWGILFKDVRDKEPIVALGRIKKATTIIP